MSTTDPDGLWENSRQGRMSALHSVRLSLFKIALEPAGLLQLTTKVYLQLCDGNTPGFDHSIAHSTVPTPYFVSIQQ